MKNYDTSYDPESRVYTKTFKDDPENPTIVSVALGELPGISQAYIEEYGVKQIGNDCHAGAKSMKEMIEETKRRFEDLSNGIIRRRASGLGLGVDLDKLTQALANVMFGGDVEQAKAKLAPFVPGEEDDEELSKKKKARLRAVRNLGEVRAEIDKIDGKSAASVLDAPLVEEDTADAA